MPKTLQSLSKRAKQLVLDESYRAHVGHIGCSLSIVDLLVALYGEFLSISSPTSAKRDHFILSKGHAALGLYAILSLVGILPKKMISTYHLDDSRIGTHPEFGVPGIELMTGSLGQGLGVGAGIALSKKMTGEVTKTVVLLSDAECNEGSVWEAASFCAHHSLPILAIIDLNGQQGFGYTQNVLSMNPMKERWESFGWKALEVDGHNLPAIQKALKSTTKIVGPVVLIAKTVLGKGIPFMEKKIDWHYLSLTQEQYVQASESIAHA